MHSSLKHSLIGVLLFAAFLLCRTQVAAQSAHPMHMPAAATASGPVTDIVRNPADVPLPVGNRAPAVVRVALTAKEVVGHLDPANNTTYRYWTFNGKVPGPMIRVEQGDTVEVTLRNDAASHMVHSVDFHAALGPGGGAAVSQAAPGQTKTFTFQATAPGLFVYHCGTPMIADHIANGMYGLILVEPRGGLPHVDHEYYLMQGEIYTNAPMGKTGLQQFSEAKLMQEDPTYFVFNGATDALTKEHPLQAKAGETVRLFFGDAGPNKPSSPHMVGEIFTKEYEAGSLLANPLPNVQTAMVAPGSAAILELKAVEPGHFNLMDHAMSRMAKGLLATLDVSGSEDAALMHAGKSAASVALSGMTAPDAAAAFTNVQPDMGNSGAMPSMPIADSAATAHTLRRKPAATHRKSASGPPTELNGCLTLLDDGRAMLKVLGTADTYRVEAQPLLFSANANRIVHVSGYVGSVVSNEDAHVPSFVVSNLDEVASNCSARVTPAMLRAASASEAPPDTPGLKGSAAMVGMTDMAFVPARTIITAGQKVTWKNSSQVMHNVVDDASKAMNPADVQLPAGAKEFGSAYLQPGQTFSKVFTTPGIYHYVCTLHEGNGMKGTIFVK